MQSHFFYIIMLSIANKSASKQIQYQTCLSIVERKQIQRANAR